MVGIAVDGHLDAHFQGTAYVHVVQIEAGRDAVYLQGRTGLGSDLDHGIQVHGAFLALAKNAARWVANDVNVGVVQGVHHTPGDLRPILAQRSVHRGHDKVEFGQDLVGKIEAAVGLDLQFATLKQENPIPSAVQGIDLGPLGAQPLDRQAIGDAQALGVVGDNQVAIAPLLRRLGHLCQGTGAIAPVGVGMQVATNIVPFDQPG